MAGPAADGTTAAGPDTDSPLDPVSEIDKSDMDSPVGWETGSVGGSGGSSAPRSSAGSFVGSISNKQTSASLAGNNSSDGSSLPSIGKPQQSGENSHQATKEASTSLPSRSTFSFPSTSYSGANHNPHYGVGGLSYSKAREKLSEALGRAMAKCRTPDAHTSWKNVMWQVYSQPKTKNPINTALLTSVFLLLAACVPSVSTGISLAAIVALVIIVVMMVIGFASLVLYQRSANCELETQIQRIIGDYKNFVESTSINGSLSVNEAPPLTLPSGHSRISIVNVFRSGEWMKLPALLLVEGDLIALQGGDVAPAPVQELLLQQMSTVSNVSPMEGPKRGWKEGNILVCGSVIPIQSVSGHTNKQCSPVMTPTEGAVPPTVTTPIIPTTTRHMLLGPEHTEILRLSGNIRCFRVLEAPVESFLMQVVDSQRSSSRGASTREDLFVKKLRAEVHREGRMLFQIVAGILILISILRLAISPEFREQSSLTIFSLGASTLIFACPVVLPFLGLFLEAFGTAEILTTLEVALRRHYSEEMDDDSDKTDNPDGLNDSTGTSESESANKCESDGESHDLEMGECGSQEEGFDDEDIDDRVEDIAEETADLVEYSRFFSYMARVIRDRLFGYRMIGKTPVPHVPSSSNGWGNSFLPIPPASTDLVNQLGAITMVCFVDDEVVSEHYSVTEEIFLLADSAASGADMSAKQGHFTGNLTEAVSNKVTVLDLHANSSKKGRFENPDWWRYMKYLKPLGMNALLTYKSTADGGQAVIASNKGNSRPHEIGKRLVRHIQRTLPLEFLRELAEEIGFIEEDTSGFSRVAEVSVIAPGLENAHLLEEPHQWGQDESRRRGSLTPQLHGSIYLDKKGLQLMSLGDPTLVLNYCRDFWDGESCNIVPLSASDRTEVLQVYERWRLEDFDVVAFAYSPVFQEPANASRRRLVSSGALNQASFLIDPRTNQELSGRAIGSRASRKISLKTSLALSQNAANSGDVLVEEVMEEIGDHDIHEVSGGKEMEDLLMEEVYDDGQIRNPILTNSGITSPNMKRSASDSEIYEPDTTQVSTTYEMLISKEDPLDSKNLDQGNSETINIMHKCHSSPIFSRDDSAPLKQQNGNSEEVAELSLLPTATGIFKSQSVSEGLYSTDDNKEKSSSDPLNPSQLTSSATNSRQPRPRGNHRLNSSLNSAQFPSSTVLPDLEARTQRKNLVRGVLGYMRQQVFLGMAASSVPVKKEIPQVKEDFDLAGIRFVYFSAQNMKRSKPIAEKIGIPFDWNCAISLRCLADQEQDPHRHISSYADWDVLARMPHGIEAIKEHLIHVDNVPLLVSLFTDSTPQTVEQMIDIFRDNGEVVLAIGSSYRLHNHRIFSSANISTSITTLPNVLSVIPVLEREFLLAFPSFSSTSLTRSDVWLCSQLVSLNCVNLLQASCSHQELLNGQMLLDPSSIRAGVSLSVLNELIRKGRVLLLNELQATSFLCISAAGFTFWNLFSHCVPLSIPPYCPPFIAVIIVIIYLPLMFGAMHFTDDHNEVLKSTPRKTGLTRRSRDQSRFYTYICSRVLAFGIPIILSGWLASASLFGKHDSFSKNLAFFHTIFDNSSEAAEIAHIRGFWLVQDVMANTAIGSMIGQAMTLLVRGQSLQRDFPWPSYYREFYLILAIVIVFHIALMAIRTSLRNCDFSSDSTYDLAGIDCSIDADTMRYSDLHWACWLLMLFVPFVLNIVVGLYVNHDDDHHYRRHLQFLRLEFDTRLGMHSPR